MSTISIIIPTLNEGSQLPFLLEALEVQTRKADEVIVADAGSTDDTIKIALSCGAKVVPGGMPATGRNAGARVASGQIFLFLDADVIPEPDFLEQAVSAFEAGGFAVATCPIKATGNDFTDHLIMDATNLYIQLITPVSPRAPGFCIFALRSVHEQIHGFDETLKLSEDHDYVRRASKLGKFSILRNTFIPVSMRRLDKEGIVKLSLKYLWCELHAISGKPIHSMPFDYEFGSFQPNVKSTKKIFIDIAMLRKQMAKKIDLVDVMNEVSLDKFKQLVEFESITSLAATIRQVLDHHELEILNDYLYRRLAILRRKGRTVFRWRKMKNISKEILQIFDEKWLSLTNKGWPTKNKE